MNALVRTIYRGFASLMESWHRKPSIEQTASFALKDLVIDKNRLTFIALIYSL